jgi:aminoglycoside/choline kinase family phosphotransferase
MQMEKIKNVSDSYFERLLNFLEKERIRVVDVEPLTPDASSRRYFRLFFPDKTTKIAMVMGDIDPRIIFEEILEKQVNFKELPFINIARFLSKVGVRVPKIYQYDGERILILGDFGRTPLDVFVRENGFEKSEVFYVDAIEQLCIMQNAEKDENCYAFELKFTKNMLMWEFNHFCEFFMGFTIDKDKEIKKEFEEISDVLSQTPYVFTHRDFHSKNLMCLDGGNVGILDFQDALLGPYVYDLVSLTCDAYVDIPENLEDKIKSLYKQKNEERGFKMPKDFEVHYAMCGIQRTLKAAGRFMFIFKEKKNKKFIPYVIPAAKKGLKLMKKLGLKSSEKVEGKIEELISSNSDLFSSSLL